jgi:hypothetical protein
MNSNAFRTQEWSNLARDDISRSRKIPPLVTFTLLLWRSDISEWTVPFADCCVRIYPTSSKKLFPLLRRSSISPSAWIQRQMSLSAAVIAQGQETLVFTFVTCLATRRAAFCLVEVFCSYYGRLEFLYRDISLHCCLLGKFLILFVLYTKLK